jgi:hypothetical protein
MYDFAAVLVSDVIKPFKWKAAITSLTVNNKRRDCHSIYLDNLPFKCYKYFLALECTELYIVGVPPVTCTVEEVI